MQTACSDGSTAFPHDVLIVEDDPIIAADFALLDVGLVREKSFAIAERLDALKIPFVFVTGYGSDGAFPPDFAEVPRLPKPCSSDALQALLRGRSDSSVGV
jgi:hypothetical protein